MRRHHQETASLQRKTIDIQVEELPGGIGQIVEIREKRTVLVPSDLLSVPVGEAENLRSRIRLLGR